MVDVEHSVVASIDRVACIGSLHTHTTAFRLLNGPSVQSVVEVRILQFVGQVATTHKREAEVVETCI